MENDLLIDEHIIYKLYVEDINYEINKITNDLITYKVVLDNIKKVLVKNATLINNRTSISLDKVLESKSETIVKNIDFYNLEEDKIEALKYYITTYIKNNRVISYQENKIKSLKEKLITKGTYCKVIRLFNKKIMDKCLNDRYVFNMGHNMGILRMIHNFSKRLSPNWGETTKKKREIIERGGVLYNGEDAKRAEQEGREYNGEMYIVYKDPFNIWLQWCIPKVTLRYLPISKDYSLKAARGNYSSVTIIKNWKVGKTQEDMIRLLPNAIDKVN